MYFSFRHASSSNSGSKYYSLAVISQKNTFHTQKLTVKGAEHFGWAGTAFFFFLGLPKTRFSFNKTNVYKRVVPYKEKK